MNKLIYTVIIIVVVVGGVWFWRSHKSANAPAASDNGNSVSADTAASMQSDLNNVNVQDSDFQAIDKDSASL
jgi:hypothetical protein